MSPPCFVSLTGYRATGKSAVGRVLASALGYDFVDTDASVVDRAGKPITAIFTEDGEPAFRSLEADVIADVVTQTNVIVALGGGAILLGENRRLLRMAGPVVWLTASPEVIRQRLAADGATDGQRPSLLGTSAIEEVEAVLAARHALYAEVSDMVIDTEKHKPDEIAAQIRRAYF